MPPAPIDEETLTQILKDAPHFSYCNNDYEKYLIEKGMQLEREKVLGVIESLNSFGYPYGGDYKYAIQQALREGKDAHIIT